jgi:putative flippase GtrA
MKAEAFTSNILRNFQLAKFLSVGVLALSIEIILYNLLVAGALIVDLSTKPATAKVLSGVVAIIIAFIGNRHWTFGGRSAHLAIDVYRYFVTSMVGLTIATTILWISYHIFDQKSLVAQNIFGNIVGTGVATIARYFLLQRWVFPVSRTTTDNG